MNKIQHGSYNVYKRAEKNTRVKNAQRGLQKDINTTFSLSESDPHQLAPMTLKDLIMDTFNNVQLGKGQTKKHKDQQSRKQLVQFIKEAVMDCYLRNQSIKTSYLNSCLDAIQDGCRKSLTPGDNVDVTTMFDDMKAIINASPMSSTHGTSNSSMVSQYPEVSNGLGRFTYNGQSVDNFDPFAEAESKSSQSSGSQYELSRFQTVESSMVRALSPSPEAKHIVEKLPVVGDGLCLFRCYFAATTQNQSWLTEDKVLVLSKLKTDLNRLVFEGIQTGMETFKNVVPQTDGELLTYANCCHQTPSIVDHIFSKSFQSGDANYYSPEGLASCMSDLMPSNALTEDEQHIIQALYDKEDASEKGGPQLTNDEKETMARLMNKTEQTSESRQELSLLADCIANGIREKLNITSIERNHGVRFVVKDYHYSLETPHNFWTKG